MGGREGRGEGVEEMRGKEKRGDPKNCFTPHVRKPEKYTDRRTDRLVGAATPTFAPGDKYPRAATGSMIGLYWFTVVI